MDNVVLRKPRVAEYGMYGYGWTVRVWDVYMDVYMDVFKGSGIVGIHAPHS